MCIFFSFRSDFKDLFDWQHFIEALKDVVHIVETLPPDFAGIEPFTKTPISWSKVMTNSSLSHNILILLCLLFTFMDMSNLTNFEGLNLNFQLQSFHFSAVYFSLEHHIAICGVYVKPYSQSNN